MCNHISSPPVWRRLLGAGDGRHCRKRRVFSECSGMRCLQDVLPQCGMVVKVGCQTLGVSAGAASRTPLLQEPCSPGGMWCGRCSVHTGPAVLRKFHILLLCAERVAALCPMLRGHGTAGATCTPGSQT